MPVIHDGKTYYTPEEAKSKAHAYFENEWAEKFMSEWKDMRTKSKASVLV